MIIIIFELTVVTPMITILKIHFDQPGHDRISNCEKNSSAGRTSSTNNKPLQSDDHFRKKVSFSWFLYLNQIIVSLKMQCSLGSCIMYITIRIHYKRNVAPCLSFFINIIVLTIVIMYLVFERFRSKTLDFHRPV